MLGQGVLGSPGVGLFRLKMGAACEVLAAPIKSRDVGQARTFGGELQAGFILLVAMKDELATLVVDRAVSFQNVRARAAEHVGVPSTPLLHRDLRLEWP